MTDSEREATIEGSPEQRRAQVIERVRHMARVPLIPAHGTRILELARMPIESIEVAELDRLINQDPGLASRLMRAANSPYYGAAQAITTVRHAIMTIGIEAVLNLALANTVMSRFEQKSKMARLDTQAFRAHSVAVGAAARSAAQQVPVPMLSPAEIGLGGLLHDIGKNIFIAHFPEAYDECIARVHQTNRPLNEIEPEVFGIAHDEVGGLLAKEWKLPAFLSQAIRWHHNPTQADEAYTDGVRLVRWGDRFTRVQQFGQGGNREPRLDALDPSGEKLEGQLAGRWPQIADTVALHMESLGEVPEGMALPTPAPPSSRGSRNRSASKPGLFKRLFGGK